MSKKTSPYRVGSLYLLKRGVYFHIYGTQDGKRIRIATGCTDLPSAKRKLDDLHHQVTSPWRQSAISADAEWHSIARVVCTRHRTHSKARGIPFEIDYRDVYKLMQEAGFVCAVSGVPLSRSEKVHGQPDPWGPSIDRIENRHGYVRGNIRVVSLVANLAMNRWGYDILLRLSNAVVANAAKPIREKLTHHEDRIGPTDAQVIENVA
jgi:hypothetical protein